MKTNTGRATPFAISLLVALTSLGSPRTAHASPDYPPEVRKALNAQFKVDSYCVPQCTVCHNTNTGGFGTLNVFGVNLKYYGKLVAYNPGKVTEAFDTYFKLTPPAEEPQVATVFLDGTSRPFFDSDRDGISDYTELQDSDSPSLPLPRGEKELCPDIKYGCFARIAAAPPPADRYGVFAAGLVVLGLGVFRRLSRGPSRRPNR